MTRANLSWALEFFEDQCASDQSKTTEEEIVALFGGDGSAVAHAIYSKGVTDGLKCALLLADGATLEEAAAYMVASLTMNS